MSLAQNLGVREGGDRPNTRMAEGVLLTGVYGSGKSSVAEEITHLLEQRGDPYALLDLDYLGWAGTGTSDHAAGFELMLMNLAAVAANYRGAGIRSRQRRVLASKMQSWAMIVPSG